LSAHATKSVTKVTDSAAPQQTPGFALIWLLQCVRTYVW
jgi:hypothetical protein